MGGLGSGRQSRSDDLGFVESHLRIDVRRWQREGLLEPNQDQFVPTGLRTPDLASSAVQLTNRGIGTRNRDGIERLAGSIKSNERVRREVAQPHAVTLVDVDGVRLRASAGFFSVRVRRPHGTLYPTSGV